MSNTAEHQSSDRRVGRSILLAVLVPEIQNRLCAAGADPGFSIGGGANPRWRGCQPPTQALFSENTCKMKEFGPVGGGRAGNFCM